MRVARAADAGSYLAILAAIAALAAPFVAACVGVGVGVGCERAWREAEGDAACIARLDEAVAPC